MLSVSSAYRRVGRVVWGFPGATRPTVLCVLRILVQWAACPGLVVLFVSAHAVYRL